MKYTTLSGTDTKISKIALGTMMWGDQVNQAEAFKQMDLALESGVNFWDTAELYTIPTKAETQGSTERILGNYLAKNPETRQKIVLASKFVAEGKRKGALPWFGDGSYPANKKAINKALENSLKRLNTDYLDLYQIHWPDRKANYFGERNYHHDSNTQGTEILETLTVLDELVKAGKIKHIGISNETPWGFMQWINLAEKHNLTKIVSVQNPYNLLNRLFEIGCSEVSVQENVGLLAYSPLAFGMLSGKYQNNQLPKGSRGEMFPGYFSRFNKPNALLAVDKYTQIAKDHGLTPATLALAFVNQQSFISSNIIGASNLTQLQENIDSINVTLSQTVLSEIEQIYTEFPDPCP